MDAARRGWTRRDFIRYTLAGAAAGGMGLTGFFASRAPVTGEYVGAQVVHGPAARGVPVVPIAVDTQGFLAGDASFVDRLAYCSRGGAPGLEASYAGDDRLIVYQREEIVHNMQQAGIDAWWAPLLGQALRPEHFPAVGDGAPVRWRSDGAVDNQVIQLVVMRVDPAAYPAGVQRYVAHGFLGLSAHCTHLCCTAGYRQDGGARDRGWWDLLACACHDAVFDPGHLRSYPWPPDGDGGAGNAMLAARMRS